jgi:renalase
MRIVVVGAGLAGLNAAIDLSAAGHDVVVFDKGRSPGGRMATRRIADARFDHGAQFFTIRSDVFAARIRPHLDAGLVYEWCRGFTPGGDGYPRYAVRGGMNALAKAMAVGLDVRCDSLVFAVRRGDDGPWSVSLDDGSAVDADAVVMTCPTTQSYSLLMSAGVELPEGLIRTEYDRTIALLVVLSAPPSVPEPGGVQNPDEVLSFVVDNVRKGISTAPALTLHASAAWSAAHWDDTHPALAAALLEAADRFIGSADVLETQVKKWRFATPRSIWPDPCWVAPATAGPLVVAGDAFAGPKVEGAVLSGIAAAAAVLGS